MNTLTPDTDIIEVGISEMNQPVMLDLNQIFGAIGLCYTVAVESYGIVRIKKNSNQAQLFVSVGEFAEAGSRTRLIIRADDGTGCTATVTYKVQVVEQVACVA